MTISNYAKFPQCIQGDNGPLNKEYDAYDDGDLGLLYSYLPEKFELQLETTTCSNSETW